MLFTPSSNELRLSQTVKMNYFITLPSSMSYHTKGKLALGVDRKDKVGFVQYAIRPWT